MPVRGLQILVLEERRGRQYDVGVIGGVGQKLLVHYGKQVGTLQSSNYFVVIRTRRGGIRTINKKRFDWRVIQCIQHLAQFHHVDGARRTTERFQHEILALQFTTNRSKSSAGRELQPTSDLLPRTGNTRQHRHSAGCHAATFRALHAVIQANDCGMSRGVFARKLYNVRGRNACPLRYAFRRILPHLLAKLFEAYGVALDVIGVVKFFSDDHMHHAQRQCGICARIDGKIPISASGGARAIRVDHYQLRAGATGFLNERPQVHVVAVDVRCPRNDVSRMTKLLGLRTHFPSIHRFQSRFPRRRADVSRQLRRTQPMEKSAVHGSTVQSPQRTSERVRQNSLTSEFGGDLLESRDDFPQRLVPGNTLPRSFVWI